MLVGISIVHSLGGDCNKTRIGRIWLSCRNSWKVISDIKINYIAQH